ncbi:MAG: hypothetical protein ACRYFS_07125 [Janthinobacterium lividum]
MIRLPDVSLPETTQTLLEGLQKTVNAEQTYAQKVKTGVQLFEAKRPSIGFRPVVHALKQMCSGPQRCCYCEDSQATDVEHIWPKDFYPELVFSWDNYLYACTRCNRPKSNICDIYSHQDGTHLKVPLFVKQQGKPPPAGDPLLINPRLENPMAFMMLEMHETFFFLPTSKPDTREWERADYTIKLLKLNEEDVLPASREEAYENYQDRLKRYVDQKSQGEPPAMLRRIALSLQKMRHPTVWHEMKRQRTFHHHQEINLLFTAAPEALDW